MEEDRSHQALQRRLESLLNSLDDGPVTQVTKTATTKCKTAALHTALMIGNVAIVKNLLENGTSARTKLNQDGESSLHVAARVGSATMVELLLKTGAGINLHTAVGKLTALHVAVLNNHLEVVQLLLKHRARVNATNARGDTPLHDAVRRGSVRLAELLLRHGADPNLMNDTRETAFFASLGLADGGCLGKLLLQHGDVNVRLKNDCGENALHLAALRSPSLQVIESLLRRCGPGLVSKAVNEPSRIQRSPLHYAIENSSAARLDVVRLLVSRGADVEAEDRTGRTPLYLGVELRARGVVEYLLTRAGASANGSKAPLLAALENADEDAVRLLLEHGARLDVQGAEHESPLHVAIRCFAEKEVLRRVCLALLARGARLDHRNGERSTALHLALKLRGDARLAHLLVDRGADIHPKDAYRRSALHLAVRQGSVGVAERLLEKGACPNDLDSDKNSVLSKAVENEELVRLLLRFHVDCKHDKRAVVKAAAVGNVNVVKLMVSSGADCNAVDDAMERSVLQSAVYFGQHATVHYLLENGADVNLEVKGRLALDFARDAFDLRRSGSQITTYLLLKHIALLAVQGMRVHDRNVKLICESGAMKEKYERYRSELESMKSTRLCGESTIAYLDLLTKRHDGLVRALRCEKVRLVFAAGEHKQKFLKYSNRVETNCRRGLKRLQMLDGLQRLLRDVFTSVLPCEVADKISCYFGDQDLQNYFAKQN